MKVKVLMYCSILKNIQGIVANSQKHPRYSCQFSFLFTDKKLRDLLKVSEQEVQLEFEFLQSGS
jgi:hypothetical protein